MEVRAWGLSEVGLTRRHNEDFFEIDPHHNLFLVADGMGGHSHGEVASRTAVQATREYLAERWCSECSAQERTVLLTEAVRTAHEQVLGAIRKDGSLTGMGTTLAALAVTDRTATVAHVGDSRIYRVRGESLDLLTQDHTWVHEQVQAGILSEDQARVHPLKNVVTRALGGDGPVEVDVRQVPLQAGDRYLLCSDGLTTMLRDDEIAHRMAEGEEIQDVCRYLVRDAKARGGFDDVTVLVVEVDD